MLNEPTKAQITKWVRSENGPGSVVTELHDRFTFDEIADLLEAVYILEVLK